MMKYYQGYELILAVRRLEDDAEQLGLRVTRSEVHRGHIDSPIALVPKDDESLPVYRRGAEMFSGSVQNAIVWLEGVKWAREYDAMVFERGHDEKRIKREENIRHKKLVQMISESV